MDRTEAAHAECAAGCPQGTVTKPFTPATNSRKLTPEPEEPVLAAPAQRYSIAAVARMFKMGRQTIYQILKKPVGYLRCPRPECGLIRRLPRPNQSGSNSLTSRPAICR
jgi:DNA invertase Pin-like site-specific DNA recombinase